jgi:predicted acetyltransferase
LGRSTDSSGIEVRAITDEERGAWGQALNAGFMRPKGDGEGDFHRERFPELGRALGAFDGGRCVGTFRSFAQELTLPGGAVIPTDAITNVTVGPTHRRRGLLSRMMRQDLDAAVARGDAAATLIAAEYRIYGRFGFGPATAQRGKLIDKARAGGIDVPAEALEGSIELLTLDEYAKVGPELHERFRRTQPGAVSRTDFSHRMRTGQVANSPWPYKEPLVALYRDAAGTPAGLLAYRVTEEEWRNWLPRETTLKVEDYYAVSAAAYAALWKFALEVDWIVRVSIKDLRLDDPLQLMLRDGRAMTDNGDSCDDFLWVRVLDVPKCFGARTYDVPGRFVFEVEDRMGYTAGRYAVEAAADGSAVCTRTADPAEFACDVSVLGALLLDHLPLRRLAAAGRVVELVPGALRNAERVLRADQHPWCPDVF